jgi:hypothetical protein
VFRLIGLGVVHDELDEILALVLATRSELGFDERRDTVGGV